MYRCSYIGTSRCLMRPAVSKMFYIIAWRLLVEGLTWLCVCVCVCACECLGLDRYPSHVQVL